MTGRAFDDQKPFASFPVNAVRGVSICDPSTAFNAPDTIVNENRGTKIIELKSQIGNR